MSSLFALDIGVICRVTTGLTESNTRGERREGIEAAAVHAACTEDPTNNLGAQQAWGRT